MCLSSLRPASVMLEHLARLREARGGHMLKNLEPRNL